MKWSIGGKSIFKTDSAQAPKQAIIPQPQNPNNIQDGETYHHWGKRICGNVNGNVMALVPFLQNVYNYIYRKQAENVALQEEKKRQIQTDITICNNNIEHDNQQINDHLQRIEDNRERMLQLQEELTKLRSMGKRVAAPAKAKMILGLVILIPLTIYLFLFYSSTFFSGFLAGKNVIKSAAGAMFNAQCFEIAWNTSKPEFFFMLLFPVIFLGLGFGLHFFSIEKGWKKYLKMAAVILVTFLFDCILAYKIGERIHDYLVNNGLVPEELYTVSMAIHDISTWAVIFCGFIAYIIWGIVFDLSMDAYGGLNQNQIEQDAIKQQMEDINKSTEQENTQIQSLRNDINKLKNRIAELTNQLNNTVFIDKNEIKISMTDFFSGWIAQMEFLDCSKEEQENAQGAFSNLMINYNLIDKQQ